jgi:hypothetical protein
VKRKPKLSTPMGRGIVDDARVRKMAKHAGVWRALRDARRQGRTVIVVHGLVLFEAAMEAGCDNVEAHYARPECLH